MADAQSQVARLDGELGLMLGSRTVPPSITAPSEESSDLGPMVRKERPPLESIRNEEILKALGAPATIQFDDAKFAGVGDYIEEYFSINMAIDKAIIERNDTVNVRIEDAPLSAALLAISDACTDTCFLIRNYGIFATTRDKAQRINAPCIPEDVPLYVPADDSNGDGEGAHRAYWDAAPSRTEPVPPQTPVPQR
jgi:hypothetical protein